MRSAGIRLSSAESARSAESAHGRRGGSSTLLDGKKLSGTSESSHLGSGSLSDASWVHGKLSFTMNGPHGSIAVKGTLKNGKLSGEFDAGQFKGTWQANQK